MPDLNSSAKAAHLEPMFLALGQAVYACQVFEDSLCMLHSWLSRLDADGADDAMFASWDFHSAKTLGGLLTALRNRVALPSDLETFLREGVEYRNAIIHRFLKNDAARVLDPKGIQEIVEELTKLKREVQLRDAEVVKLLNGLFAAEGFSVEDLKIQTSAAFAARNQPGPRQH